MDVEFTQISDVGRVREGNEDYLGVVEPSTPDRMSSPGWLFAVADGVGGHAHGEVASHAAVEAMLDGFRDASSGDLHKILMARLVQQANKAVLDAGHASDHMGPGMATTIVACALRHDRATIAHVGDSRCYLIREGNASILTRDHTTVNDQVRMGVISAEEAERSEHRHMLSRSLGGDLIVAADIAEHQVYVGDTLVLCTDGLYGYVTSSEIAAIAGRATDLKAAAQRLVDLANQRDGGDNITLQIIRVRSVERVGMYRGRPYRLP